MKRLLLLLLCVPAYAAPLPSLPVVKRPAPLLSPKDASAPKVTAMVKTTTGSTSYPNGTMVCTFTRDINILHCDTNSADCFLYDFTSASIMQRAGYSLTFSMVDSWGDGGETEIGFNPAAPFERESGFNQWQPAYDRVPHRFIIARQRLAPTGEMAPASSVPRVNPALKGVTLWTRPK